MVLWPAFSEQSHAIERWQPPPNALLSVIFTNVPSQVDELLAIVGDADLVELDGFDVSAATITALHARGKKVLCYLNFGAWETWRADAANRPASAIGNAYKGWPNEYWLDIRKLDVLLPIFTSRIQMAKDKGCDGIDSDNLNGYENVTGFPLTRADQIRFNLAIADVAHGMGLPIGMKNGSQIVADMVPAFDWVLVEGCYVDRACALYSPFVQANKAVFDLEYDNDQFWTTELCPYAGASGVSAMMVNTQLDGWREACTPSLAQVDAFFEWAQATYPVTLPAPHGVTQSYAGFTYRCYAAASMCLGTRAGYVYYVDMQTGQLGTLGDIRQFWSY